MLLCIWHKSQDAIVMGQTILKKQAGAGRESAEMVGSDKTPPPYSVQCEQLEPRGSVANLLASPRLVKSGSLISGSPTKSHKKGLRIEHPQKKQVTR